MIRIYTPTGKADTVAYQSGTTVAYDYDRNDNLNKMQDPQDATTYTCDAAGRMSGLTQFNDTYMQYTYDNANRLILLDNRLSQTGNAFATYAYILDGKGDRTGIDQTVPLDIL